MNLKLTTLLMATLALAPVLGLAAPGSLGDLGSYDAVAQDTLKIAEKGDLAAARARIKDLETEWDENESKLEPKSPDDWTTLDKAIDKALAKLRSGKPDKALIVEALNKLIKTIDSLQKPK